MTENTKLQCLIHYIMAMVGGFIGAYALLNYNDFFASSQTTNLIHIVLCITGRNLSELIARLGAVFIYLTGLAITVLVPYYTKINLKALSISIEIFVIILLGIFNTQLKGIYALYPIFFITSIQWNSFKGVYDFNCSTIFSTNNLKQFFTSFLEYLCDKNKAHLRKTSFYGLTLLFYHIGVAISVFSYIELRLKGIFICLIPLILGILLVALENKWLSFNKIWHYNSNYAKM